MEFDEIDMVYRAEIEDFEVYLEDECHADKYARLQGYYQTRGLLSCR